jgi:hypothetical protein
MNVSLDNVPQTFNPAGRLILTLPTSILRLVDYSMHIKILTVVIAAPEVSKDFRTFLNVVSDHLSAGNLCSVFHHESSHIFCAAFIES